METHTSFVFPTLEGTQRHSQLLSLVKTMESSAYRRIPCCSLSVSTLIDFIKNFNWQQFHFCNLVVPQMELHILLYFNCIFIKLRVFHRQMQLGPAANPDLPRFWYPGRLSSPLFLSPAASSPSSPHRLQDFDCVCILFVLVIDPLSSCSGLVPCRLILSCRVEETRTLY